MELSSEAIKELKKIHLRLTGEKLTETQATAMGQSLFRLFLAVYQPLPEKWLEEFENKFGKDKINKN